MSIAYFSICIYFFQTKFLVTGELLRCIVIVDAIARIEIETTARVLYLEDSPEELIIRGYDDEGWFIVNRFLVVCCI